MFSLRLYRLLLQFYPATFRETYAGPLEREFLDHATGRIAKLDSSAALRAE